MSISRRLLSLFIGATALVTTGGLSTPVTAAATAPPWVLQTEPVGGEQWISVAYGNGLFVAVSYSGFVMTSADGENWSTPVQGPLAAVSWTSVTYGDGIWVAVSQGGQVMWSEDPTCTLDGSVTSCWTLGVVATTTRADGRTSVTYGNGRFVAVGYPYSFLGTSYNTITSTDGKSWTPTTDTRTYNSVVFGNNKFVALGQYDAVGTRHVFTSLDGVTWTPHESGTTSWKSVTYGKEKFVAVGRGGDKVMTSADGENWTIHNAVPGYWESVTYGNGLFRAVAAYTDGVTFTSHVMSSADGETWSSEMVPENNEWQSVTFGAGIFVAVAVNLGGSGSSRIMTSGTYTPPASPQAPAEESNSNNNTPSDGGTTSGGATSGGITNAPTPGVTVTDTTVYTRLPRQVAENSSIIVLNTTQTKTQRLRTETPAVCLTTNDDIVFIDEGRCNVSVLSKKTGGILRRLRTTAIDEDIVELGIGNQIATLAPIYFSNGSSVLSSAARKRIASLEDRISEAGTVLVAGHTGIMTGDTTENRALSRSRAVNTVREMKRAGATGPFYSVAVGAADPEVKNTRRSAQAKNRRVVIVLVP